MINSLGLIIEPIEPPILTLPQTTIAIYRHLAIVAFSRHNDSTMYMYVSTLMQVSTHVSTYIIVLKFCAVILNAARTLTHNKPL